MAEILTNIRGWRYFTEDEMQKEVDSFLKDMSFYRQGIRNHRWYKEELHPEYFREIRVPEVNRISDHIIYFAKNKIINIECKKENYIEVIAQAKDHLRWANYSLVCLPVGLYIPNKYILDIIKSGLGLILYFPKQGIYQTINPKWNKNPNEQIRKNILARIKPLKLAI